MRILLCSPLVSPSKETLACTCNLNDRADSRFVTACEPLARRIPPHETTTAKGNEDPKIPHKISSKSSKCFNPKPETPFPKPGKKTLDPINPRPFDTGGGGGPGPGRSQGTATQLQMSASGICGISGFGGSGVWGLRIGNQSWVGGAGEFSLSFSDFRVLQSR